MLNFNLLRSPALAVGVHHSGKTVSDMTQAPEHPAANTRQQYDTVSKVLIRQNPDDWVRFSLGISDAVVVKVLESEQPTVTSNRADSFIHVRVRGNDLIVHLEMQTHDSTDVPMPRRMAGYVGRAIEFFGLPVHSHVIYLHPRAGSRDPGEYMQEVPGYEIRVQYKVIRLCDLEGEVFLSSRMKGLIPFTPLMKPPIGIPSNDWLRECVRVAEAVPQDVPAKADYLSDVAILSGLIFDYPTIRETIREAIMHESSVIQHFLQQGIEQGVEQGIEQGTRESLIESILENLEVRFQVANLQAVRATLESVEMLQRLRQLRRESLQTPSLDAFRQALARNVSPK